MSEGMRSRLLQGAAVSPHAGLAGLAGLAGRRELSPSEAELVLQCWQEVCWAGTCQGCCSVCLEPGRCRGMYASGFLIPGVAVFLLDISVTECGGFAADQVKESRTDGSHGYPSALF